MSKIMYKGIEYSGGSGGNGNVVELTLAEYKALSQEEKNSDTVYFVTDATPSTRKAENTQYDNTKSGLSADNVQSAIDELTQKEVEWTPTFVNGSGTITTANMIRCGNRYDFFVFADVVSNANAYVELSIPHTAKYNGSFSIKTVSSGSVSGYISKGTQKLVLQCSATNSSFKILLSGFYYAE